MQCAIPPRLVATVVSDCQKAARYHSRSLLFRLRQTVRDFNPRGLRSNIDMFRGFNTGIGIQSPKTKTDRFWMVIVALQNRRTTAAAKTSPLSWRGFPLFEQLSPGDEAK